MTNLYETDVLAWSEHQAELLRRQFAGESANEAPDWGNISEEIEGVGRSEFNAVWSLLVQALMHDLKCQAWPSAYYVPHWRAKACASRADAAHRFTPSMRQQLNPAAIYRQAVLGLPVTINEFPGLPVPNECRLTVDELLERNG